MKERKELRVVWVAMLVSLMIPSQVLAKKLRIVATTSDLGAIVRVVAGDRAEVKVLAKGHMDPHYLEAKPSYMAALRRADLLVYNGLQLEIGWLPVIIKGSRSRKITSGQQGNLTLARGVKILEIPTGTLSRTQGDVHPDGNPHYTMDPRNWIAMAEHLAERLSLLDPAGRAGYLKNFETFRDRFTVSIDSWEQRLAPFRGQRVICFHKHWEYLLHWLGLEIVDYVENKPGIPVSPNHLLELQERIKAEGITLLLSTTYASQSPLKSLAKNTNIKTLALPGAIGAVEGTDEPFALFERIISALESSLERRKNE